MADRRHKKLINVVYVVAFLDLFSASMITTCLPTYLTDELRMSPTTAGIVGSIYGFVQFFSSPVIGSWSDNYGYKRILCLCLIFCVPAYACLSSSIWIIVILGRILSGSFKHTQTLSRTYLATFATDSEKMQAYGRLNAMGNIGFVFGPAVEAWLLANYGYWAVFYCTAFAFAANAVLISVLLTDSSRPPTKISPKKSARSAFHLSSIFGDLQAACRNVDWSRQWDLLTTRFLLSFATLLYRSSYGWMMQGKYHINPATIGYVTSYQGLMAFFASVSTGYVALLYVGDNVRLYEHVILLNFVAFLGLIFSSSFSSYILFLAPFCISTSIMRVVTLELTTERTSKSDVGLLLGVSASTVSFARALSPAIGGVLHDWHPDAAAVFCLIFILASYVITNVYTRWYTYGEDCNDMREGTTTKE